ncbi:unnamed protein product [Cylindrotheca closterium]|uniref:Uncharacterized protein n=1 Tax=Cylindrotheca closterium TaxID=2856 RepID=A0AAD2FSX6_9STRA|nr:unnamed protein product [Cylindrotheca closterium]
MPQNTSTMNNCNCSRRRQRQVRFASQEQCLETISRSQLTRNESAAAWYSRNERIQVIQNCARLVERRQSGKKPKRNNSYRGLETFHELDFQELRQHVDACVYAVILEQHRQAVECRFDSDSLAKASLLHSNGSSKLALVRAKNDECEAKQILCKTCEMEDEEDSESQSMVSPVQLSESSSSCIHQDLEELGKVVLVI